MQQTDNIYKGDVSMATDPFRAARCSGVHPETS